MPVGSLTMFSDIQAMEHKTTSQALAVCIADNDAVVIWGPPGNGKTETINTAAKRYNLHLETVIASIREPSDFAGIPFHENRIMHLAAPSWAQRVVEAYQSGKPSVVFYDEISTAAPQTQAALLRPILEGVVGDLALPEGTRTVAAANFPDEAADGWDLSAPVANRFVHLDWELDAPTVKQGFVHGWQAIEVPAFPRPATMQNLQARSLALVGIFLSTRPNLVNGKMKDRTHGSDKPKAHDFAFPSPRAWETAARLHAACQAAVLPGRKKLDPGVLPLLLNGTVGKTAAAEFINYVKTLDLPDPDPLLDGTASFRLPERGDQILAICSSLFHAYKARPSPQRWINWGNVLAAITRAGKSDAAFSFVKEWHAHRPQGVMPTQDHIEAFSKILNLLEAK